MQIHLAAPAMAHGGRLFDTCRIGVICSAGKSKLF